MITPYTHPTEDLSLYGVSAHWKQAADVTRAPRNQPLKSEQLLEAESHGYEGEKGEEGDHR